MLMPLSTCAVQDLVWLHEITEGSILFSAFAKHIKASSPLHAEVLSIQWGLQLGAKFGLQHIIVESDSKSAIQEIGRDAETLWEYGVIIMDIRDMRHLFNSCLFIFTQREENKLAYLLANMRIMSRIHVYGNKLCLP
ncbi:hypothetical protein REPUB_Repub03eG0194800 [Reevesia pubescens]